jgi:hypothetical protein
MTALRLTQEELNNIHSRMNEINEKQQKGEMSLEDALNEAIAARKLMADTLDRTLGQQTEFRVKTWNEVRGLISALEAERFEENLSSGPKFKADDILDIEARAKIQEVRRLINTQTLNGRKPVTREEQRYFEGEAAADGTVLDEQYSLIRMRLLNDYGKYIQTNHPEMVKLRKLYHDRNLSNYEGYARSQYRKTNRDKALYNKVIDGIKNRYYTDNDRAQAVANLLHSYTDSNE